WSLCLEAAQPYVFRHIDANVGLSDNLIKGISSTPDGRISIQTQSMLNLYNGGTFDFFRQDTTAAYAWDFVGDEQQYVDTDQRIWSKQEHPLQLFSLKSNQYITHVNEVLAKYGVRSQLKDFSVDDDKNLWFVTADGSLQYYDIAESRLITIPP